MIFGLLRESIRFFFSSTSDYISSAQYPSFYHTIPLLNCYLETPLLLSNTYANMNRITFSPDAPSSRQTRFELYNIVASSYAVNPTLRMHLHVY